MTKLRLQTDSIFLDPQIFLPLLDKELAQHSQFVYESYALEWSFDWQLATKLTLTTSVGRQLHNRYEMTLRDGSRVRLAGKSVTRYAAKLRWCF